MRVKYKIKNCITCSNSISGWGFTGKCHVCSMKGKKSSYGMLGKKMNKETLAKKSIAMKGKNTWSKGTVLSMDTKNKISLSLKTQWLSGIRKSKIKKIERVCNRCCNKFFMRPKRVQLGYGIFCSIRCLVSSRIGKPRSEEVRTKIGLAHKGVKEKYPVWNKGKKVNIPKTERWYAAMKKLSGPNNYNWIHDRSKLAKRQERNDMAYKEWRRQVWLRDNFTCKIVNPNCAGRIEAHHILGWTEYPELRYQINNGITLCHAHHPRRRAEEKRLIPEFQGLVSVLSE